MIFLFFSMLFGRPWLSQHVVAVLGNKNRNSKRLPIPLQSRCVWHLGEAFGLNYWEVNFSCHIPRKLKKTLPACETKYRLIMLMAVGKQDLIKAHWLEFCLLYWQKAPANPPHCRAPVKKNPDLRQIFPFLPLAHLLSNPPQQTFWWLLEKQGGNKIINTVRAHSFSLWKRADVCRDMSLSL